MVDIVWLNPGWFLANREALLGKDIYQWKGANIRGPIAEIEPGSEEGSVKFTASWAGTDKDGPYAPWSVLESQFEFELGPETRPYRYPCGRILMGGTDIMARDDNLRPDEVCGLDLGESGLTLSTGWSHDLSYNYQGGFCEISDGRSGTLVATEWDCVLVSIDGTEVRLYCDDYSQRLPVLLPSGKITWSLGRKLGVSIDPPHH